MADRPNVMIIPGFNLEQARKEVMGMNGLTGYCEKHHQPWDIKCVNGQWVCECPKCRAEGLLDTYTDNKTTPLTKEQTEQFLKEKEPFMFEWDDGGDDIH